jgi:hypothetical protein
MRNKINRLLTTSLIIANQPSFAYVITILIWILTLLSRLAYNGLIYGFDYGLFHPDGSLYAFRSLIFAGYTEFEAGREVAAWYETNSFKAKYAGPELYFENNPFLWDQYMTRVLYPLISVPFVLLFGIPGMLVVPALTFLVVLLVTTRVTTQLGAPIVGWFLAVLVTSSTSISRWMFANITDGLLLLFVSLFILIVSYSGSLDLTRFQVLLTLTLITLSAITRFSAFFWLGIAVLFLIHRKFMTAISISVVTVISHVPIFLRPFSGHVLPGYNEKNLVEKLLIYPVNFAKVSIYEIGQLFVLDRLLLLLILTAVILSLKHLDQLPSQMFIISGATLWLTGSINGVLGVNFRYQLPLTPVLLYLFAVNFSILVAKRVNDLRDSEQE